MSRADIPQRPKIERAKGKDRWPLNTHNAIVIEGWKDNTLKSRLLELTLQGYSAEEIMEDNTVLEQLTNGVLDRASSGEKSFADGTVKLAMLLIIRRLVVRGKGLGSAVYKKWKNQTRSRSQVEHRSGARPAPQPLADWVIRSGGKPIQPRKEGSKKIRRAKVQADPVDAVIIEAVAEQAVPEEQAAPTPEVIDHTAAMGDIVDRIIKETAFTPHDFVDKDEILEYLQEQGITLSPDELSDRLQRQLTE